MSDVVVPLFPPRAADALGFAASKNPAVVYLARLGAGSRRSTLNGLKKVAAICGYELDAMPWQKLRYAETQAIRSKLTEECRSPRYANTIMDALRGVLKECWQLGMLDAETLHRTIAWKKIPGEALLAGREIQPAELRSLFAACARDETLAGLRDGAMLAVLYGAGLRRAEIASLTVADVYPTIVAVRSGKGSKAREVAVAPWAWTRIETWIAARGPEEGALFPPIDQMGRVHMRQPDGQIVYDMLKRRGIEAEVALALTPHDFRRTWITTLLASGANLIQVQKLAGHSSPKETAKYDRSGPQARQQAANLLPDPTA